MAFTTGTATFTNGSTSVTGVTLSGGSTSYFGPGTRVVVGSNPVASEVEAVSAPSAGTFTLRNAWTLPTGSYSFLANMTSEGVRDAAQTLRDALNLVNQFNVDVNPTANTIPVRDANGRINAVAGAGDNDVLTWENMNTFGGAGAGKDIAVGIAAYTTAAFFYLPILSTTTPVSRTVTGTYSIFADGLAVRASGITASSLLLNATQSSNRVAKLVVSGLSGLVAREPLILRAEGATDSIRINF